MGKPRKRSKRFAFLAGLFVGRLAAQGLINFLVFVYRFRSKLHAQFFEDFLVHRRQHDRGMYLAAFQLWKLFQSQFSHRSLVGSSTWTGQ